MMFRFVAGYTKARSAEAPKKKQKQKLTELIETQEQINSRILTEQGQKAVTTTTATECSGFSDL
jgi:hypothetical protein